MERIMMMYPTVTLLDICMMKTIVYAVISAANKVIGIKANPFAINTTIKSA